MNGKLFLLGILAAATPAVVNAQEKCIPDCPPPTYQADEQADEQNVFVAPRPQGEVAGESESFGLRGFAIRIPESTIRLPTIQFPGLVRFRRNAEMIADSMRMPIANQADVEMQFAPTRDTTEPQSDVTEPQGEWQCNPRRDCVLNDSKDRRLDQLEQNMSSLQAMMKQLVAAQQNRSQASASYERNQYSRENAPQNYHSSQPTSFQRGGVSFSTNHEDQRDLQEVAALQRQIKELEAKLQQMAEQRERGSQREHRHEPPQILPPRNKFEEQPSKNVKHVSFSQETKPSPLPAKADVRIAPSDVPDESLPTFEERLNW